MRFRISYVNQKEIDYLSDIERKGPGYVCFLESMNFCQMDNK